MVGIHFGNHERNIRVHAEILRVAEHELSGSRKRFLDFAGDAASSAEKTIGALITADRIAIAHVIVGDRVRHHALEPACRLAVLLARATALTQRLPQARTTDDRRAAG